MLTFVIIFSYFIMFPVPYKKKRLIWQDSNLEYFNYKSEILSISRLFYVIQIYINSLKHVIFKIVMFRLG